VIASAVLALAVAQPVVDWEPVALPAAVRAKLPAGHVARLGACSATLDPPNRICVVVAARPDERRAAAAQRGRSPARPLLVYRLDRGGATLIARNDRVVLHYDEGGQCDPIQDTGAIAIKGRFFTLESGVSCGQHWTDYTTFRFDPARRAFVWHNRISENWELNVSSNPDAQALVSDGKTVRRADPRKPVALNAYVPR